MADPEVGRRCAKHGKYGHLNFWRVNLTAFATSVPCMRTILQLLNIVIFRLTEFEISAAVAEFKGPVVMGVLRIAQVTKDTARVEGQFDGLKPGPHAVFLNQYGDLTRGAASTGGIYIDEVRAFKADSQLRSKLSAFCFVNWGEGSLFLNGLKQLAC